MTIFGQKRQITDHFFEFFSMKYAKQKRHFFQQPQIEFGLFWDFLKLEVFPEENPTQKLANSLGPRRNWQKNSKCVHIFFFFGQK